MCVREGERENGGSGERWWSLRVGCSDVVDVDYACLRNALQEFSPFRVTLLYSPQPLLCLSLSLSLLHIGPGVIVYASVDFVTEKLE